MLWNRVLVPLLLLATTCVWCHPSHQRHRSVGPNPEEAGVSLSSRRIEKMLEKAILKIITGDLSPSDMQLLKSLNYGLEEVLAIRQHELDKKMDEELRAKQEKTAKSRLPEIDYEEFNHRAVEDYENLANKMEEEYRPMDYEDRIVEDKKISQNAAKEELSHVVFKIRYDDSEFDSTSLEKSKERLNSNAIDASALVKNSRSRKSKAIHADQSVRTTPVPTNSTPSSLPLHMELENRSEENDQQLSINGTIEGANSISEIESEEPSEPPKRLSPYEGLEWVEDDVYRVIPEALNYDVENYAELNGTMEAEYQAGNSSLEEMTNDYFGYQEDQGTENGTGIDGNITSYHQVALAHRRDQGQRAIEDIKLRVLALTGRFNLSTNTNQVQRERLTMFSPTCQTPKNIDAEAWSDPFSMNMYFQLNLTSSDHIVAAKLRIYKLPQVNPTVATSNTPGLEYEEEEEKKIRISIYFYTKSLKKHRSKKRLMDSVVTSLTPDGGHLALDVRQALRFWRQPARSSHSTANSNHGLLIQVEDQDGRPLKPAMYLQQDACHTSDDNKDEKAYQRVPAIFIQACSRYVRVVNGETITYANCKNLRNFRH